MTNMLLHPKAERGMGGVVKKSGECDNGRLRLSTLEDSKTQSTTSCLTTWNCLAGKGSERGVRNQPWRGRTSSAGSLRLDVGCSGFTSTK